MVLDIDADRGSPWVPCSAGLSSRSASFCASVKLRTLPASGWDAVWQGVGQRCGSQIRDGRVISGHAVRESGDRQRGTTDQRRHSRTGLSKTLAMNRDPKWVSGCVFLIHPGPSAKRCRMESNLGGGAPQFHQALDRRGFHPVLSIHKPGRQPSTRDPAMNRLPANPGEPRCLRNR
jgi:hypothetical protein